MVSNKRSFLMAHGASRGARSLSRGLSIRRLRPASVSRYRQRPGDTILNWGCTTLSSTVSEVSGGKIINPPERVDATADKKRFFLGCWTNPLIRVPLWTTDPGIASGWRQCVSRTLLRASGGRGIVITEKGETPPQAPLYVEYIPKRAEYRIHVIGGEVVDCQRKIRNPDTEPTNWRIRSHDNGFIFARESGQPTDESKQMAIETIKHFGLDFGAVDIIENRRGSFVLEVNTAPGLEGQTLTTYTEKLKELIS